MPRILHLLSQRPSMTGSGITLDALVRHAESAGWDQQVVVGVPADEPSPEVGGLENDRIQTLQFETPELPFPVPGMSDVMPYRSTRWSDMLPDQLRTYRQEWIRRLHPLLGAFSPDLIHVHHLWILGALVKDLTPATPVISHCHATGLRQMRLCPHLAEAVRIGCRRNEKFAVLHSDHADQLQRDLKIPEDRIHVIGAGYREDLFHRRNRPDQPEPRLLFIGKYAHAKGLPWLLDAFEKICPNFPNLELHVAGTGTGPEAVALHSRLKVMAPSVVLHGQLNQTDLAALMRQSTVCVLPSFYEGVPLVLIEALASGCRLVATDLPGVVETIVPRIPQGVIEIVPRPRLDGPDAPVTDDLPAFTRNLAAALERSITAPHPGPISLEFFTWKAVFDRVERMWEEAISSQLSAQALAKFECNATKRGK
ncbi:MAG: hypothetical protein DRJ65_08180 [Acidobacteria bacterium]|nr:MAG: hypothetical protein DRJ65_08180 [Acidobacteriota bacterium]